ncbi:hypothetical protein Cs7R123_63790 [Catellatospora sp. TT07R-123]|nr:hypothetical protein Cs7R123_63790 [Catellatospora sp. TT07R-123]
MEKTQLESVKIIKWAGEVFSEDSDGVSQIRLSSSKSVKTLSRAFQCRYDMAATLFADDDHELAEIEVVVIASFILDEEKISRAFVNSFLEEVGYFVIFPYAREALQAMSMKLGVGPFTLGLLQQGQAAPATASVRGYTLEPGSKAEDPVADMA